MYQYPPYFAFQVYFLSQRADTLRATDAECSIINMVASSNPIVRSFLLFSGPC
jgi:hypothetical protein